MALVDSKKTHEPAIQEAAERIRELTASVLGHADTALLKIRNIVREHGRAAVAAELGADAAAMLAVYNRLKDAVEAGKSVTIDDLPA